MLALDLVKKRRCKLIVALADLVGGKAPRASLERDPGMSPEMFNLMSLNQVIDCSKAVRELGFKPVALKTMYGDLCAWMRAEGLLDPK